MLNSKNVMNNWESSQSSDRQNSSSQNSSLSNLQTYYSKPSTNSMISMRPTVRFTYRSRKNSEASSNMGTPKKNTNMINLAKRSASYNSLVSKKNKKKSIRSCKQDYTQESDENIPMSIHNQKNKTKYLQVTSALVKSRNNFTQTSNRIMNNHQLNKRKQLPRKRIQKQFFENEIFEIQQTAPQEEEQQQTNKCHNNMIDDQKIRRKSK